MNLALGTAQFGMNYGISNIQGQVKQSEITKILEFSKKNNINTLDTAYLYGESEIILGDILQQFTQNSFKIITKLPILKYKKIDKGVILNIDYILKESLLRLKIEKVYGLLMHCGTDLLLEGGEYLQEYLLKLKRENKVKKIGVSVYSPDDLERILDLVIIPIDIVQLPLNVIDQRFLNTMLFEKLEKKNIEIYFRSIFLQGLLLMPKDRRCSAVPHLVKYLERFDEFLHDYSLRPIECCLGFIKSVSSKCNALLGVTSLNELKEILEIYHNAPLNLDYKLLASDISSLIDPRTWNEKA